MFELDEPLAFLPATILALAIGLLIGAEREWSQYSRQSERLMAGIRTFGLLGLVGSLSVVFSELLHPWAWAFVSTGVMLLIIAGYIAEVRATGDWGMTTEVAMLVTYLLGSLATLDHMVLAAALGVVVAALLSLKAVLHTQVHRLEKKEISGALKLLFISVVILPLLPNESMGPMDFFNPSIVWWMVVLITGLGFVAYVAMRVMDASKGLLWTAVFGGLVSSTAMTLTLSRLATQIQRPNVLSAGLLLTSALMFPRVLVETAVLARPVFHALIWPLLAAMAIYLLGAAWLAWRGLHGSAHEPAPTTDVDLSVNNPFEIGPALRFTAVLVAIMFLVKLANEGFGDAGIYLSAAISGAADVDAISLSLSRMASQDELAAPIAARGILIAALSNSLVKLALAAFIGGWALFYRTAPFVLLGLAVAALWLF
jgi:uncharacterized membrane protein (DUF4010 family)